MTILDFDNLYKEISAEHSTGIDLRQDYSPQSVFYKIKDTRARARALERNALIEPENFIQAEQEWREVKQLTISALEQSTKDLEIAAWLTESLLHTDGFVGLKEGLVLLNGLIEKYWDELYPFPDEDGLITKLSSIINLSGEENDGVLISPVRAVPLTNSASSASFAYWHYQQAIDLMKITDTEKLNQRIENGAVSMQMIQNSVAETSADFFVKLINEIKDCKLAYTALVETIEQKCDAVAIPSSRIQSALDDCIDCLNFIAKDKLIQITAVPADSNETTSSPATVSNVLSTNIQNREQAFQLIEHIAAYFRTTEPHSPLAYVLERSARWGRMPLHQLLNELISDDQTLKELSSIAGIPIDKS